MDKAQVINSIKQLAKNTIPPQSSLLLYGSQARGEEHAGSDWDLLILLDKAQLSESDYDKISFPLTLLGCNIGELISPQLYTKKGWLAISFLPFYKNVERDKIGIGMRLYDEERRTAVRQQLGKAFIPYHSNAIGLSPNLNLPKTAITICPHPVRSTLP